MNKQSIYPRDAAFSLVELLTVMAIMAILAFTALPSIMGTSASGQLASAGNLVVSLAHQARQNSITQNAMTALVMVSGSEAHPHWNNRLFVLMELAPPTSATASPSWTIISKWEALPQGVVVDPGFISPSPPLATALPSLNCHGALIPPSDYVYQIFLPTGGLLSPAATVNTPPILRLVTGVINGAAATYTSGQTGGNPNNYYKVTINPYTGMLKVTRP